jgi:hypothetical protein
MVTFLAAAAFAPIAHAPIDTLKLARSYKAGDTFAYSVDAKAEMGGQTMEIRSEVVFKVKKADEKGAELSMSVRKFSMMQNGSDAGHEGPGEMTSAFDAMGMPHVMSTQNESWVYILASFAGLVPGKDVELGNGFDIKWESKDKVLTTTGKGKATELVDHEGAKAVKIEYDLDVHPGEESTGHVKCTTLVAQDGITPISCKGTVNVEGDDGQIKFTVTRLKS